MSLALGWKRPWLVTEFGPRGYWECPKTEWGAPVEQTSTEKAEMLRSVYAKTIAPAGDCLGSAPTKPGAYRVFVMVSDGHGHVGTANFPFQVK